MKESIEVSNEQIASFNEREALFRQPMTYYSEITELATDFQPYMKIWELALQFDQDKHCDMLALCAKLGMVSVVADLNIVYPQDYYQVLLDGRVIGYLI